MAITAPTDAQLAKAMLDALNARILEAAEPIIEKAVKEFEIEMRAKLASNLIGLLQTSFSMERNGTMLQITVREPSNNSAFKV